MDGENGKENKQKIKKKHFGALIANEVSKY